MRKELLRKIRQTLAEKRRHKVWRRVVSAMMAVAVFCTTYALILPAITLEKETYCGIEEHVHSEDECYITLEYQCSPLDEADYVLHTHSEDCYDENGKLVCGLDYLAGHTHGESCYDAERNLTCTRLVVVEHQHTAECFDESGALVCDPYQDADYVVHAHDASCTGGSGDLICTLPEVGLHTHEADCYDENGTLICGLPQVIEHTHTDECKNTVTRQTTVCSPAEDAGADFVIHTHNSHCYNAVGELICALEERTEHTHSESCYTEMTTLICTQEEDPGHTHSESCYTNVRGDLTCTNTEEGHEHTDDCYTWTQELTCGQEENEPGHVHDESCYETTRTLTCTLPEVVLHTHTDECYVDGVLSCGQPAVVEHQHTADCISEVTEDAADAEPVKLLICSREEHTHTDQCYVQPESLSFTCEDGTTTFVVNLPWQKDLPDDLSCEIVTISETDENYAAMINSVSEAMGGNEATPALLYRLEWFSDGVAYTLPVGAEPTVTVTKTDESGETPSLTGFVLTEDSAAEPEADADMEDEANGEVMLMALSMDEEDASDDSNSTDINETTDSGSGSYTAGDPTTSENGTLSLSLANANTFALLTASNTTATPNDTKGYFVRVDDFGQGDYQLQENTSSYYVIISANGNYRLAGSGSTSDRHADGVATEIRPIKGHENCYTLADIACGQNIVPATHKNSFWIINNATTGNKDRYFISQLETANNHWGIDWTNLTLAADSDYRGGSAYGDHIELIYRATERTWWFRWWSDYGKTAENTYLNLRTGSDNQADPDETIDGHKMSEYPATGDNANTLKKVYSWINTDKWTEDAMSKRNFLIFRWVPGDPPAEVDDEKGAAEINAPDPADETTYNYKTNTAKADGNANQSLANVVGGAAVSSETNVSTYSADGGVTDLRKSLGGGVNTVNSDGTKNETAYNAQAANDGRLLTSKTVQYGADPYGAFSSYDGDEFSVTLSALAQEQDGNSTPAGESTTTTTAVLMDVVFVLDTSSKMSGHEQEAASAINAAMTKILEKNAENRVGVVGYDDDATVIRTMSSDTGSILAQNSSGRSNMQLGLETAYDMFSDMKVTTKTRQPIVILVSAGEPTMATYNYMEPDKGPYYGDGSSHAILGYYSILSAQYFKNMIGVAYGVGARFYTIGIGELTAYQKTVLNPSDANVSALQDASLRTVTGFNGTTFQDGATTELGANLKHLLLNDREGSGGSGGTYIDYTNPNSQSKEFPQIGYTSNFLRGIVNPYGDKGNGSMKGTGYDYCDEYEAVTDTSTLTKTLTDLMGSLTLHYNYNVEQTDMDGNKQIVVKDYIGEGMEMSADGPVLLWYKQASGSRLSDPSSTALAALTPETTKKDDTTGAITYIWSGYNAWRTGTTDASGTNAPDSKKFGTKTDWLRSLGGNNITAVVQYEEIDGKQIQTVTWTIPTAVLPALYPDLYERFYYEEPSVHLVYKVGLSEESIETCQLLGENNSATYSVGYEQTDSVTGDTYTATSSYKVQKVLAEGESLSAWASNDSYAAVSNGTAKTLETVTSTTSKSGESLATLTGTLNMTASGTLTVYGTDNISVGKVTKTWVDHNADNRETVSLQLYREGTGTLVGVEKYFYYGSWSEFSTSHRLATKVETLTAEAGVAEIMNLGNQLSETEWRAKYGGSVTLDVLSDSAITISGNKNSDTWTEAITTWANLPLSEKGILGSDYFYNGANNKKVTYNYLGGWYVYIPIYDYSYKYYVAETEVDGYDASYNMVDSETLLDTITIYESDGSYSLEAPESGSATEIVAAKLTVSGTLNVTNDNTYILPKTGGIGTDLFTWSGAALILLAAGSLYIKKRGCAKRHLRRGGDA